MRKIPANIAILIVLGLALVCITILAALHSPIPEVLTTVALVAAGGGAGLSLPATGITAITTTIPPLTPTPAPVTAPVTWVATPPTAPVALHVPQGATTPTTTP
jgi:hypothetical protein